MKNKIKYNTIYGTLKIMIIHIYISKNYSLGQTF